MLSLLGSWLQKKKIKDPTIITEKPNKLLKLKLII